MAFKFEDDGIHAKHEVDQTEEIIVFSKENCSYCMYINKLLTEVGLDFTVLKLGEDFTKADFYKKFGTDSTFPRVEIDEVLVGGCRDTVEWMKKARYIPGH